MCLSCVFSTGSTPLARPSSFRQGIADAICERLALGESLRQICRDNEMPDRVTVIRWKNENAEFRNQYARAREDQADIFAELGLEAAIHADDPAKGRLAFDAYRWAAGKLKPGTYGDKVQHAGSEGTGPVVTEIRYRWADPVAEPDSAAEDVGFGDYERR
jgi:hypothetical protein